MLKRFSILAGIFLATAVIADSFVIARTNTTFGSVIKNEFYWTTSTNSSGVECSTNGFLRGEIERVSLLGSTATNDYTVTMTDSLGFDMLTGLGALVPSNTVTTFKPAIPFVVTVGSVVTTNQAPVFVNDQPTISITNAGVSVRGIIVVFTK